MGRIFCVMGKSATGKDTIYQRLLGDGRLDVNKIVPYTTRPIRQGEVDGETYIFCDEDKVNKLDAAGKIIELRAYNTVHGVWKYFTVDDGQFDLANRDCLIIGTLEAYTKIKDYFGADAVVPIYIEVEDGLRLERALSRERKQQTPKYEEMCRRFLADAADFSEEKLAEAGITEATRFTNLDLEETIDKISRFIEGEM